MGVQSSECPVRLWGSSSQTANGHREHKADQPLASTERLKMCGVLTPHSFTKWRLVKHGDNFMVYLTTLLSVQTTQHPTVV